MFHILQGSKPYHITDNAREALRIVRDNPRLDAFVSTQSGYTRIAIG